MEAVAETRERISWFWLPEHFSHVFYLLVIVGLFCAILTAIQLYRRRQNVVKVLSCFPEPPSHWLYGHVKMLKPEEEFLNVAAWTEKYPHCHQIWFGCFLGFLLINHPEYAKAVYSRGDSKSLTMYNLIIPWIGMGLLTLNGPKWRQHRKLLTPGFHYEILKPYLDLMVESVKVMLDKWEKLVPKGTISSLELYEPVSLMTLDSIMKCAFSYHSNCQTDRDNKYINTVLDLTYLAYQRLKTPLYHSDLIYWCSPQGRQFRKACRLAHNHTDNVIRERKESLKNEQELEKILKKRRLDFLDILLCAKDEHGTPLSDEDLRAEVDTFMFEGHDTTASGISWLLYCMAQNPEHQQRCREEIKELLEEKMNIQWDDLGKMTYCTMCIKESLRLYPSVPYISRELNAPVTFADGRSLPKGCIAALNIYGLHRNPEIWDNPEVFNPLRFSPENSRGRHPYAFLPFAAGPRNCIGQQFAMNELKVALALILLWFELFPEPSKPPIPSPQMVIRSINGIHVKLKALS
ncbi:cytochrome P450 4B1-like [Tiliqua scincoides]|uniref:cytochrome P450 4B1-like n=1 Tax=Tiliqua scincoides TaxID=71010 RepID=UPI0034625E7E